MKKYLISGFNTVQDVKLEAGTYTLVAYAKSMYSNVYTFALGDGENWTEYDIDVVQGQLCKVWLTFTIDKRVTKFKPIANNFSESLPVYVTDLQLTRGNIPVEAGASPFDIDQILNDLHDGIDAIEDFTEGAFLDGLLSREEKTQLRASLDSIGSIVKSVEGSYDKLLDNPFIHENTMDSITARYYAFIASWISDGDPRGLKPVILWIVNGDNIVSQNEREEKDRALNAFNDALYAYNQAEKEVYSDVGANSIAPIITEDGFWAFWDKETETFIPSEFSAIGDDGHAPIIRDGYWYEWNPALEGEDKYQTTGVRAEGVKGDGVQQKFLSSDEKPTRPTGDAIGWSDIPDEEEAPDVPLEPIGDNLYDKQYLLNTGWLPDGTADVYRMDNVGYVDMFPPTVFKSNTQYKYTFGASSYPDWRHITIQYSDNSTEDRTLKENFNTAKNKTVVSIKIHAEGGVYISNTTKLYELGGPAVQAKPIWTIFRNITDGVASEWSEPVKWLGEGTPGKDGDPGEKGEKGDPGTSVKILGSFNTPSELSGVSNPALGDGYMINGDLWVYVGGSIHTPPAPVGWNNVGRIKGDKGKDGSSYLVLGYWSPDYEYQLSDAGIPVVKQPGSATFLAYKLIVPKSTVGQFINTGTNKEWELVDSSEFTYMLEAYIEVLQAELITAEKIESLNIRTKNIEILEGAIVKGAIASPFKRTTNLYGEAFSNNLIVTGDFTLPWDQKGSGRLIRLIQPNPGVSICTAPAGFYFFEDGVQKSTLKMLGAEIIELLGYTDRNGIFVGWLVLNRGLMHTVSTWGEPQRIVAQGRYKTNNPFKYHAFDGSTITAHTNGDYVSIIMPTHWFDSKDGYYVKVFSNGVSSAIHTVSNVTEHAFGVQQFSIDTLDNNKINLVTNAFDFFFEVHSAAKLYGKSGSGGMPGEDW